MYGCDTYDPVTGLINRPTAALDQFTYSTDQPRYRYAFVVDKARQYIDLAQRVGDLLLAALQNSDNEAFQQLKAEHAIELAGATVELRRLGQTQARDGMDIAKLQSQRADSQVDFWAARAGDDIKSVYDSLSSSEKAALDHAQNAINWITAAQVSTAATALPAIVLGGVGAAAGAATAVAIASGLGIALAPLTATLGLAALGGAAALGQSFTAFAGEMAAGETALSNQAQMQAANERRFEDWKNQFNLATFDAQIAGAQENLANDQLAIADQEVVVAQLQLSQAREELRFLENKITNVPFYDWMVRVLSRDYRALMQIAAATARLAQRALEFERQQAVGIIVGDYWNIAAGVLGSPTLTQKQRSLGLLGAERLSTDLTKLDAFKLASERRRQQISKTISLARMMPTDLVMFRQTGSITLNTLMDWFDDDFQGHYLRLIKSVKVTILAIVPPIEGIHAMLQNTGESSVVVTADGGRTFVKKRAMRNFGERISLDAPFNETGLFVLNYEDPMLLPFEDLGVETQWTLELPRGNNRFNFDTIADVLLTIEYTAEYSSDYEARLRKERQDVEVYEDTAVPLRFQFPDLWYHLKHQRPDPLGSFSPFAFTFELPRTAFAPNLADPIEAAQLTLLLSGDWSSSEQDEVADGLTIRSSASSRPLHSGNVPRPAVPAASGISAAPAQPGDPTSAFGYPIFGASSVLLSTRGNSANGLRSNPPIGTATPDQWTVEFSSTLFPAVIEKMSDVLLVITCRGKRA